MAGCTAPAGDTGPVCGNGLVEMAEQCDDGNQDNNDLCLNTCVLATCGDGFVFPTLEQCDDGAANANDAACKLDCTLNVCGDGYKGPGEECDDGPNGSATCTSDCKLAVCGDGLHQPGEQCDDGGRADGDGCSHDCQIEQGWTCHYPDACECATGYAGADCTQCAAGYQDADGNGTCLPGCDLYELTGPGCTAGTTHCEIQDGAPSCACDDGLYDQGSGCAPLAPCTVFVAVGGSADGSSWSLPIGSVQGAVDAAQLRAQARQDGTCQVWVEAGVYPIYGTDPTDTLHLRPGVQVYGGFIGSETKLSDRLVDPATGLMEFESLLDGQDAVQHVVTGSDDARLDGFVIAHGKADGDADTANGWGGGLLAQGVSGLVVASTEIRDNFAERGGGAYLTGTSVELDDVRFFQNSVHWDGGGLAARDLASLTVRDAWFGENSTADGQGGAMHDLNVDSLDVEGTTFQDNDARWDAGGLWHVGGTTVVIAGSRFADNDTRTLRGCLGSALLVRGTTQDDVDAGWVTSASRLGALSITDTDFVGNHAMMEGGAAYLKDVDAVDVVGGTFASNEAFNGWQSEGVPKPGGIGGALVGYDLGDVSFTGTSFSSNRAGWKGGAVALLGADSLSTSGVTFSGNQALTGEGGGLLATGITGAVTLKETVFEGNTSFLQGGGADFDGFATLSIDGGSVLRNTIDGSYTMGAGLFVRGDIDQSQATVDGTVFDSNFTGGAGSGLTGDMLKSLEVDRALFQNNGNDATKQSGGGGGIYTRFVRDIVLHQDDFEDDGQSRSYGPGTLYATQFENADIRGTTFAGSTLPGSGSQGGAVLLCNGVSPSLSLDPGDCGEPYPDGDLYAPDAGIAMEATVTIANSDFENNDASQGGSGLWTRYIADLWVDGSTFVDNHAINTGGAMWIRDGGASSVTNSQFTGNSGSWTG